MEQLDPSQPCSCPTVRGQSTPASGRLLPPGPPPSPPSGGSPLRVAPQIQREPATAADWAIAKPLDCKARLVRARSSGRVRWRHRRRPDLAPAAGVRFIPATPARCKPPNVVQPATPDMAGPAQCKAIYAARSSWNQSRPIWEQTHALKIKGSGTAAQSAGGSPFTTETRHHSTEAQRQCCRLLGLSLRRPTVLHAA